MMKARILWIDEDRVFLEAHYQHLLMEGYEVDLVRTFSEAIKLLKGEKYGLLILDVILSIKEDEEKEFPPSRTEDGQLAGLVFFEKYKELLEEKKIKILVFTIRDEPRVRNAFLAAGLKEESFMTKQQGEDVTVFLERIQRLLGREE